jgi:membrane associated rhomboid family serine protease
MAYGRRGGPDLDRILTLGHNVPRSVGGILIAMVVCTVASMVSPTVAGLLVLHPEAVLSGQVWRLVTWVLPNADPITLLFAGFVLFWLGRDLANTWSERKFLQVFFGYALWAACWTTLIAQIWAGADHAFTGAWPVVNGLLVGWAFSRPGAQINFFMVLPMTGRVFGWVMVGLTVLFALSSPNGAGDYVPHLAALVLTFLMNAGITPRRLWLRAKQGWYDARLKRRSSHLRPVKRDDKPNWMN